MNLTGTANTAAPSHVRELGQTREVGNVHQVPSWGV